MRTNKNGAALVRGVALIRGRDRHVHSWVVGCIALALLGIAVLLGNGVPPVGAWLGWFVDQIANDTGWGKFLIALLAGIISAFVAVLTVRLTDRSSRRRAQLAESQRAAESLTRVLVRVWHEANEDGVKPDTIWKSTQRFHEEQLVQRAILRDAVLKEQVLQTNHALRDWASLRRQASRRWGEELETDSASGEAYGPDFEHSKTEAWREALLQVESLGEALSYHRQGIKADGQGRPGYVKVELVDARSLRSESDPVPNDERPTGAE
jgi:hypothetical protein